MLELELQQNLLREYLYENFHYKLKVFLESK